MTSNLHALLINAQQAATVPDAALTQVKKNLKLVWRCALGCLLPPTEQEINQIDALIKQLSGVIPKGVDPEIDAYCCELIVRKVHWTTPVLEQPGHQVFVFNDQQDALPLPQYTVQILQSESPFFAHLGNEKKVKIEQVTRANFQTLLKHLYAPSLPQFSQSRLLELQQSATALGLTSLAIQYEQQQLHQESYEELYSKLCNPHTQPAALDKLLKSESKHLLRLNCFKESTFETFCVQKDVDISALSTQMGTLAAAVLFPRHTTSSEKDLAAEIMRVIQTGNAHESDYFLFAWLHLEEPQVSLAEIKQFLLSKEKLRDFIHLYLLEDSKVATHPDLVEYPTLWRNIALKPGTNGTIETFQQAQAYLENNPERITPAFKAFCQTRSIWYFHLTNNIKDPKAILDYWDQPNEPYFHALIMLGDYPRFYAETKGRSLSPLLMDMYNIYTLTKIPTPPRGFVPHFLRLAYRGLEKMDTGNYQAAIDDFSLSLEDQSNPGVAIKRALCYWHLKEFEKAEADLDAYPIPNEEAALLRAQLIVRKEGFEAGKAYLELAIPDPNIRMTFFLRLLIEAEQILAIREFLLTVPPGLDPLLLAQAYAKIGDGINSMNQIIAALKINPADNKTVQMFVQTHAEMPLLFVTEKQISTWQNTLFAFVFSLGTPQAVTDVYRALEPEALMFYCHNRRGTPQTNFWPLLSLLKPMPWDKPLPPEDGADALSAIKQLLPQLPRSIQEFADYLICYALEDYAGVIRCYEEKGLAVRNTPYQFILADAYRACGEFAKARDICNGHNGGIICELIKTFILIDEGKTEAALPFLKTFIENKESVIFFSLIERAMLAYYRITGELTLDKWSSIIDYEKYRNPELIRIVALEHKKRGFLENARELFPEDRLVSRYYASDLIKYGYYYEAACELGKLLVAEPEDKELKHLYGTCLYHTGRFKKAILYLNRECATNQEKAMLADSYHHLGKNQEAYDLFKQVWETMANDYFRFFDDLVDTRALLYWKMLDLAQQLNLDRSEIDQTAKTYKIKRPLTDEFLLAKRLYQEKQTQEAIRLVERMIRKSSISPPMYRVWLIKACVKEDDMQTASRHIRLALDHHFVTLYFGESYLNGLKDSICRPTKRQKREKGEA